MNLFYETPDGRAKLYLGDSRHLDIPDESIDMIATSPPYWGKRDYGEDVVTIWGGDNGCEHEWGGEVIRPGSTQGWSDKSGLKRDGRPEESRVKTIQSSPKRDTQPGDVSGGSYCSLCSAWRGQLGLEPTWQEYISHLCECAKEWMRILKPTGNLFVNMGDTFHGGKGQSGHGSPEYQAAREGISINKPQDHIAGPGLTRPQDGRAGIPKMKLGIPYRLRFALNDMGWVSRDDIIWYKGKEYPDGHITKVAMPESVKDRMSCSYEMVFHFVKEPKGYWFDLDAVRRPHTSMEAGHKEYIPRNDKIVQSVGVSEKSNIRGGHTAGANPGDVWIIQPEPFKEAHYAVWPSKLCERMIKVGCPKEVCPKCGKPRERITVGKSPNAFNVRVADVKAGRIKHTDRVASKAEVEAYDPKTYSGQGKRTIGWSDCGCGEGFVPGVILDPFFGGSGRIAERALYFGRNVIGVDMKEEYLEMAKKRLLQGVLL